MTGMPAPIRLPALALVAGATITWTGTLERQGPPADVVVYASELPRSALSEFAFRADPAAPGGKFAVTPNTGGELDPPPEDDPNVTFTVSVQRDMPYRCWVHMKVGTPKGVSQANRFWIQFSHAVGKGGETVLKPGTGSYLTAQGPEREGWVWVGCEPSEPLIRFATAGAVTVRMQAGMEGVGFDQLVLSPGRFLNGPPAEAVITKP